MSDTQTLLDAVIAEEERCLSSFALRTKDAIHAFATVSAFARASGQAHDDALDGRIGRLSVDHEAVVGKVRTGDLQGLSGREARYASVLFEDLTVREIAPLLRERPRGWRQLATTCFREWDRFSRAPQRAEYARLFDSAPDDASRITVGVAPSDLLGADGPALVAKRFAPILDTQILKAAMEDAGLSWRWEYTAHVLVRWVAEHPESWDVMLPGVLKVDEIRLSLLPPRAGEDSSHVRPSLYIRSRMVGGLLTAAASGKLARGLLDDLSSRLLASEFGDVRIPPLSEGWEAVRALAPDPFNKFVSGLVQSDLRFFFKLVRGDAERLAFWERQLSQLQSAFCVLDSTAYDDLQSRLKASNDRAAVNAFDRAKRARRTGSQRAQAFVLFFRDIVVVEYSETGNAAYIFPRAEFERRVLPQVQRGITDTTDLKKSMTEMARITHASGWQSRAQSLLRQCEDAVRAARR